MPGTHVLLDYENVQPSEAELLVADRFARMARLQHAYGRDTPIHFSYVHDFVYGYDWAKWVARGTDTRIRIPTMAGCETCGGKGSRSGKAPDGPGTGKSRTLATSGGAGCE